MLPALTWANNWDQWLLYHKAIFDGPNKLIYIDPAATEIDVRVDLYSDWKEWMLISQQAGTAMKWAAAFRSTGGDPLPGDEFLGRTFFLINGWRILLDHGVNFTGNIFTEEGDSPAITADGVELATFTVSTLVVENTVEASVTAADISQAVWDLTSNDVNPGSLGEILVNLQNATILNTTTTGVGSTTESIQTGLSKADDYYNNMFVTIVDSVGDNAATRQIDRSFATGQINLIEPLPWTPSSGAAVIVLGRHYVIRGSAG